MKILCCIRLAALASAVWFVTSCAHTPVHVADTQPRFHEGASVDVILRFYRWDTIHMTRPDTRENGFLPLLDREGVARELARQHVDRNLAVVVVGYLYSLDQEASLFQDWKSFLGDHGFRRVVLLRVGGKNEIDGLPILHDSAIAGGP